MTQEQLGKALARIFKIDQKYVVLLQGNWFNPQYMLPTAQKPMTWVAYRIAEQKPITVPYYSIGTDDKNYAGNDLMAYVRLQIVGTRAEELAQSVGLWTMRADVLSEFAELNAGLMYSDFSAVTTNFYQDGMNEILSYNVTFKLAWKNEIQSNQEILTDVTIGGTINVE